MASYLWEIGKLDFWLKRTIDCVGSPPSSVSYEFSILQHDNSDKLCGGCYSMAKCDAEVPDSCSFFFTLKILNFTDITFTIMLTNNFSGYIAVGFSVDNETVGLPLYIYIHIYIFF